MITFWPYQSHFDHFRDKKTCFLGFLKVVLELFRSYAGIIFGPYNVQFLVYFQLESWINNPENRNSGPRRGRFKTFHFNERRRREAVLQAPVSAKAANLNYIFSSIHFERET